jgi:hypothetical protein
VFVVNRRKIAQIMAANELIAKQTTIFKTKKTEPNDDDNPNMVNKQFDGTKKNEVVVKGCRITHL